MSVWGVGIEMYQCARVLAVKGGDVVGRHFADIDLEMQEPAWEERDITRVQNVDVRSPYLFLNIACNPIQFNAIIKLNDMMNPSNLYA